MAEPIFCLGFKFLGECSYNPAIPSPSYFTIGDAVAALAFTLAVNQFLKPIYQFRLQSSGIRFSYVVWAVFVGAFCTVVAAAIPNLPLTRDNIFGFPVFWEIFGGMTIGAAYLLVAIISLRGASVTPKNVERFARAGARLLASATDEDRSGFAQDVLSNNNLSSLMEIASEFERAELHAVAIEFEKCKALGNREAIHGRPKITAFYEFTHRRNLKAAHFAHSFLMFLSDPNFCGVVVSRHSWEFLDQLQSVSTRNWPNHPAETFVQAVVWQSLLNDESMLAKEVGFSGFGHHRIFAKDLFGNYNLLRSFQPLGGYAFGVPEKPTKAFVQRFNVAAEMMFKTAIDAKDFWPQGYIHDAVNIYENLFQKWSFARYEGQNPEYGFALSHGIQNIYERLNDALGNMDPSLHDLLFITDPNQFQIDLVADVANIIFDFLCCVSNKFEGSNDPSWMGAFDVFRHLFPSIGNMPKGMSPLQQALAFKIVDKIRINMDGYYPTLSRVMLSCIGPYYQNMTVAEGTAYSLLRDAVYIELKRLPILFKQSPEKIVERLPYNVRYDEIKKSLIHTYSGGQQVETLLDNLQIEPVDFLDNKNLRRRNSI